MVFRVVYKIRFCIIINYHKNVLIDTKLFFLKFLEAANLIDHFNSSICMH